MISASGSRHTPRPIAPSTDTQLPAPSHASPSPAITTGIGEYLLRNDTKRVEGLEDEGVDIELSETRDDFESLAGWVAGDANQADRRQKRKLALLEVLSEALESVL